MVKRPCSKVKSANLHLVFHVLGSWRCDRNACSFLCSSLFSFLLTFLIVEKQTKTLCVQTAVRSDLYTIYLGETFEWHPFTMDHTSSGAFQEIGHFFQRLPGSSTQTVCHGGPLGVQSGDSEGLLSDCFHYWSQLIECGLKKKKLTRSVLVERESAAEPHGDASVGKFDRRKRAGCEV